MKRREEIQQVSQDAGPWVDLGNGRSRSASTGRMRYDPNADPAWHDSIKRIQAQEQAAAAKRALDALGTGDPYGYSVVMPVRPQLEFSYIKRVWWDGKLIWEMTA